MTVTVADRNFRRFSAIPAVSGHQTGVEGSVFAKDHFAPSLEPRFAVWRSNRRFQILGFLGFSGKTSLANFDHLEVKLELVVVEKDVGSVK